ncbi:MAG: sugar transferase, partial [Acidobacteriota bacterium]|nr:sugar transferase [Acidobacteriota bacterium]
LSSNRITNWRAFALVHFALDILALATGWYAAIHLRIAFNPWMTTQLTPEQFRSMVPHPFVIVLLWTGTAVWMGLYRRKKMWSAAHAIRQAVESDVVACALALFATFFAGGASKEISRSFLLLFGPLSFLLLTVSFYSSMTITCAIQRRWSGPRRVAVLGGDEDIASFMSDIETAAPGALTLAGVIVPDSHDAPSSLPVLGTVRQLAEVINRERLDQLICMSSVSSRDFEFCGAISHRMGVTFSRPLAPALWNNVRFEFNSQYGVDFLDAEPVPFTQAQEIVKRAVDIGGAALLLILLAPLLLLLALLVRVTSPGPVFHKSPRVGKGGRHFMFWKFRSMVTAGPKREELLPRNEHRGHIFKMRNDPRVTPLGRVIRRFSLDELPQLFNVLLGEMSLVGPRPLPAEDMEPDGLSREHAAWAEQRVQVRPGITGIWQIRGRSDLSFEQMVEFDMQYIRNWSLGLDIQILLETPVAVFSGRGAY